MFYHFSLYSNEQHHIARERATVLSQRQCPSFYQPPFQDFTATSADCELVLSLASRYVLVEANLDTDWKYAVAGIA
jgi:ABC-type cobalamin transport system ATPase subunit